MQKYVFSLDDNSEMAHIKAKNEKNLTFTQYLSLLISSNA